MITKVRVLIKDLHLHVSDDAAAGECRQQERFLGLDAGTPLEDLRQELRIDPHAEEVRQVPGVRRKIVASVTGDDRMRVERGVEIEERASVTLRHELG